MHWRSPRSLMILLIGSVVLVTSVGIGIYLINRVTNSPQSQWVRLPPSKPGQPTPTAPPDGYLFKDAAGNFVVYHLPTTPPTSVTWVTYRNQQDGYTLDSPSKWLQVKNPTNGHDGWLLYPPGTHLNEDVPGGAKGIGLGWVETHLSVPNDATVANITSITRNGVNGEFYTQAGLGTTITALFPYKGGTFILTADATSDTLIYVFHYMLTTLTFP